MDEESPEDIVVIQRVLRGETEAFRALVRRYGGRLHGFCLSRLGNEEDAADAVQDVLLRAYRSLPSFKVGMSFASWLFAIAANRVRTRGMRESARLAHEGPLEEDAGGASDGPDPADQAVASVESAEVRAAVARLPWPYRVVVEMYYLGGLTVEETAASLGLGVEAVKTRLFRARRMLAAERPGDLQRREHLGGIRS